MDIRPASARRLRAWPRRWKRKGSTVQIKLAHCVAARCASAFGATPSNARQQVDAGTTARIRGWEAVWVRPRACVPDGHGFMPNCTDIDLKAAGHRTRTDQRYDLT